MSRIATLYRLAVAGAVLMVAALLGGCAATRLDTTVHTQGSWPPGRAPGSYTFERLPSQMAQPGEQDRLEGDCRPALERAGFRPAAAAEAPDVRVQVAARSMQGQVVYAGPYYGGPWGPWGGARWGYPGWGAPGWGGWGGWGWGSPAYAYFVLEVAVLILDAQTQRTLYESRAQSEGAWPDEGVWAALCTAALQDFPLPAVSPRRVTVDLPPK